jgi:hypothetical protein
MPVARSSPPVVPYGADQTVCVVIDDFPEHLHDFVGLHAAAAEDVGDGREMKMQKEKSPRGGFS